MKGEAKRNKNPVQNRIGIGLLIYGLILNAVAAAVTIALSNITATMFPGESAFRLGLIDSGKYVGNIIMLYPLVKISNWIGRKLALILGIFLILIGLVLLFFGGFYWLIVIARLIMGLNACMSVISAISIDHFPEKRRGSPLSLFSIGSVFGYIIGTLIGEPMYQWLGSQYVFIGFLVISAINIIVVSLFIKDVPRTIRMADSNLKSKEKSRTWKYILNDKRMVALLISTLLIWLVMSGSSVFVVYIIFTHIGLGSIGGLFIIPGMLAQAATYAILGARRKDFKKFYILLIPIGIAFTIILSFHFMYDQSAFLYSVCCTLASILYAGLMQSTDAISHKIIPPEHKTNMVSIYRIIGVIGSIIGPSIFMAQTQYIWAYSPGYFLIILEIILLLLYFFVIREKTSQSQMIKNLEITTTKT